MCRCPGRFQYVPPALQPAEIYVQTQKVQAFEGAELSAEVFEVTNT